MQQILSFNSDRYDDTSQSFVSKKNYPLHIIYDTSCTWWFYIFTLTGQKKKQEYYEDLAIKGNEKGGVCLSVSIRAASWSQGILCICTALVLHAKKCLQEYLLGRFLAMKLTRFNNSIYKGASCSQFPEKG